MALDVTSQDLKKTPERKGSRDGPRLDKTFSVPSFKKQSKNKEGQGKNQEGQIKGGKKRMREQKLKQDAHKLDKKGAKQRKM
ncbi:hypothetical protein T484DRAFT_1810862 [Baffinella frigidus]|nr:hypothetical protein T484DRAFT_1810862 [Cryptophyta sp. CCMP2293]